MQQEPDVIADSRRASLVDKERQERWRGLTEEEVQRGLDTPTQAVLGTRDTLALFGYHPMGPSKMPAYEPGMDVVAEARQRNVLPNPNGGPAGDGSGQWQIPLGELPNVDMDIWFSAGGPRGKRSPFGCSPSLPGDPRPGPCSLYHLSLSRYAVPSLRRVRDSDGWGADFFQPAVSPSGSHPSETYVAYMRREHAAPYAQWIEVTNEWPSASTAQVSDPTSGDSARFPSWYEEGDILWTRSVTSGEETVEDSTTAIDGAEFWDLSRGAGGTLPFFGPNSVVTQRQTASGGTAEPASFGDAEMRPASAPVGSKRDLVMHSKKLTENGESAGVTKPIVMNPIESLGLGVVEYEVFELGCVYEFDGNPVPFNQCHHPSWGASGEIMCWAKNQVRASQALSYQGSYVYERSSSANAWTPGGTADNDPEAIPAFPFPTLRALTGWFPEAFEKAFSTSDAFSLAKRVGSIAFKYSRFAPGGRYLVTTLLVGNQSDFSLSTKGFSRVLLVRRSDGAMWDLTAMAEADEGATIGTWGGTFPSAA